MRWAVGATVLCTHKSNMDLPTTSYYEGYQVSGVDGGGHHWENLSRMESVKIQWNLLLRYSNLRLLDPIWSSHCYSWWRMSQLYTRIEDQGLTWKMSEVFSPAQFWTVFSRNWYMSEPVRGRISGIITSSSTESSITQSQPRPGLSILRCWTTSNIGVNDDLLNLTYDCDSLSKVAVKTPAGITKRVDVQKVVTQGEVISPLKCTISVDCIAEAHNLADNLYNYKGQDPIPPLGMVDDQICVCHCGPDISCHYSSQHLD